MLKKQKAPSFKDEELCLAVHNFIGLELFSDYGCRAAFTFSTASWFTIIGLTSVSRSSRPRLGKLFDRSIKCLYASSICSGLGIILNLMSNLRLVIPAYFELSYVATERKSAFICWISFHSSSFGSSEK